MSPVNLSFLMFKYGKGHFILSLFLFHISVIKFFFFFSYRIIVTINEKSSLESSTPEIFFFFKIDFLVFLLILLFVKPPMFNSCYYLFPLESLHFVPVTF